MALDGIGPHKEVGLLGDDVPHSESRPDIDGLIGDRLLPGHALLPDVLHTDTRALAPESGEALPRLTILARRPPPETIETFEGHRRIALVASLESDDLAFAGFRPVARLIAELRGIAEALNPRRAGERESKIA